jgi:hypothetical protein
LFEAIRQLSLARGDELEGQCAKGGC